MIVPGYKTWGHMKARCYDPKNHKYRYYGARGITVCDRWMVFANFIADMGLKPKGLTIERIDNDGNYEPGNCRWATLREQSRNRRFNRHITAFGRTQLLVDWSHELGWSESRIHYALKRGETMEAIFRRSGKAA